MDTDFHFTTNSYTKLSSINMHEVGFYILDDEIDDKDKYDNEYICDRNIRSNRIDNNQEDKHVHRTGQMCLKAKPMTKLCSRDVQRNSIVPKVITKEADLQRTLENDSNKNNKPTRMNWHDYHRLNIIHTFLEDLECDFPSICTVGVIGTSLEGRNLKILKISNSDTTNQAVWVDAGIHAREWIAPAVATYIANHIVHNFTTLPTSITNKDWYFHPVVNPDGYEYSHTGNRLWRKNKAWHGGACVGVDLNRNFSYGWGGKGSSDQPSHAFYRGPEPFSEPESCAIRDILLNSGIQFKIYITLHSYGQVILFPFAYRDEVCPDYVRLLEGATIMSKAIYESSGNTYKVGISRDVMYGAAGTSCDWSYGEARIPYCYLIELTSKKHKFMLPKNEIEETGNAILNCIKALMEFVDENPNEQNVLKDQEEIKFKVAPTQYKSQVWEIRFTNEGQRYFVKSLDTSGAINIWKEERSTMDVMVEGPRSAQVAGMLHEREIPYAVAVGDVDAQIENEQGNSFYRSKRNSARRRTMDWRSYHRLDVIYAFMEDLVAQFPCLCAVTVIGQSVEGRDLKMLKISNGNSGNESVWVDASIHAREWISVAVVTYFANHLVRNYHELPDTMTNKDWYILPVLNPDGYEYTHTHDRMWRKNRARYGECVGVDLNRNFGCGWGEKGEEGSSEDPGNIFFRGSKPFSEPETAAVKNVILDTARNFKVFLSFHSYGEVIIFPWGYIDDPCPDYVELLQGGIAMAKAIFDTSGHTYKVGGTKDLMYYAAGTSIDWSYGVANIPYSFMIELRGKNHRFLLPKEEIIPTAKEVMSGIFRLMDFVDRRCRSTESCVCSK